MQWAERRYPAPPGAKPPQSGRGSAPPTWTSIRRNDAPGGGSLLPNRAELTARPSINPALRPSPIELGLIAPTARLRKPPPAAAARSQIGADLSPESSHRPASAPLRA